MALISPEVDILVIVFVGFALAAVGIIIKRRQVSAEASTERVRLRPVVTEGDMFQEIPESQAPAAEKDAFGNQVGQRGVKTPDVSKGTMPDSVNMDVKSPLNRPSETAQEPVVYVPRSFPIRPKSYEYRDDAPVYVTLRKGDYMPREYVRVGMTSRVRLGRRR